VPAPIDPVETSLDPTHLVLVWIDSRESSIVRQAGDHAVIDHLTSDVPPHRRARGNQQHGPVAAGGDDEPRRLEHLARFLHDVSQRIPPDAAVLVVGPGTVRWRLARVLHEHDTHRGTHRTIHCRPAPRWTDRQLLAEFNRWSGRPSRRRTVGTYRWSQPPTGHGASLRPTRAGATPEARTGRDREDPGP
jgi:hypothetical protein